MAKSRVSKRCKTTGDHEKRFLYGLFAAKANPLGKLFQVSLCLLHKSYGNLLETIVSYGLENAPNWRGVDKNKMNLSPFCYNMALLSNRPVLYR